MILSFKFVSLCCFQTSFRETAYMFCLRTSKRVSLGYLIGHGFYPLLAMVYKCFNIYLLRYRVYLECLQVHRRFGGKWWFWCLLEPFECRAAQMRQMYSYGWRPSHRYIKPIFLHKIHILVMFPMPPVWGQSASCGRRYVCFTKEWSVCLARGSCRGDEGLSIDVAALVSIDSDARIWAEHILWSLKPIIKPKLPEYPLTTRNPILLFLSHCWRLCFILFWRERA